MSVFWLNLFTRTTRMRSVKHWSATVSCTLFSHCTRNTQIYIVCYNILSTYVFNFSFNRNMIWHIRYNMITICRFRWWHREKNNMILSHNEIRSQYIDECFMNRLFICLCSSSYRTNYVFHDVFFVVSP